MEIIDRSYVKELFKYIGKHEEIYVPYRLEERYSETMLTEKLPVFLDTVINYADKHNIPEYTGMNPYTYCDDRFYYYLTFDGLLTEIGMLYDGNQCYIMKSSIEGDEEVIDCEDILFELENSGNSKAVTNNDKKLSFKPQKKENKKENN